ncbi:hypothetical protein PTSG_05668 [Salpingoeca rosetta]|uniref:Short-chain dehydrogenase/reductase SDR n=1 Tax=Salpingoeca rosetta (strain ATCC 50818 / BSB-021) TaxID=946362 RepID=F2UBV8_SALR5|nr:uncharacterized protein PTSG_05668 [Salpingoeca rosetta]EGD73974.1 hypothetical protein PTSG_05668 [Salpingoeca rosetta]|eukprot:XP_004993537.1 hypothetical protein PTSG_05668 [Salpingoeca rosetta]
MVMVGGCASVLAGARARLSLLRRGVLPSSAAARVRVLGRTQPRFLATTQERGGDRVALVTGGSQGIGRATVDKFLEEGWHVVNVDTDNTVFSELKDKASRNNRRIVNIHADVADDGVASDAVSRTVNEFGQLDCLVNNAGILPVDTVRPAHEYSLENWHRILHVNLHSAFYFSRAALRVMVDQHEKTGNPGGVIVNIGSVHGLQTAHGVSAYAASKGAILSLTRQLALDYGKYGIRVLAVNPGTILTPSVRRILAAYDETEEDAGANYPLQQRAGKPSEVASVVHFLATDGASFMTGSHVEVDGGITIVGSWE